MTRTVTRYGRADGDFDFATKAFGIPTDLALGTRRARAGALLSLALPGAVYLYQGEGWACRAEDARDRIQDPIALPLRRHRPGPGRLPVPVDGRRAVRGLRRRALAAAAERLVRVRRRPPGRRPRLDALPLPRP